MRKISRFEWPFYKMYTWVKWNGPGSAKRKARLDRDLDSLKQKLLNHNR